MIGLSGLFDLYRRERWVFKPRGVAEWFKYPHRAYKSNKPRKAYL